MNVITRLEFELTYFKAGVQHFNHYTIRTPKYSLRQILIFCWLSLDLSIWWWLGDLFVSQNPSKFYASHSPGQIMDCVYTIWHNGKILISCTIPSGPPSPSSLILLLYYFAIFAHDMINSFISITIWSIFDIFLRLIYFHLNIVDFHGV